MNDILEHTDRLRVALRSERGNFRAIADQSGLTYHWLVSFAQGKIRNPTIKNVDALDRVLAKRS